MRIQSLQYLCSKFLWEKRYELLIGQETSFFLHPAWNELRNELSKKEEKYVPEIYMDFKEHPWMLKAEISDLVVIQTKPGELIGDMYVDWYQAKSSPFGDEMKLIEKHIPDAKSKYDDEMEELIVEKDVKMMRSYSDGIKYKIDDLAQCVDSDEYWFVDNETIEYIGNNPKMKGFCFDDFLYDGFPGRLSIHELKGSSGDEGLTFIHTNVIQMYIYIDLFTVFSFNKKIDIPHESGQEVTIGRFLDIIGFEFPCF